MKKLKSNFVNMILVLTAICGLAALLLSAFFSLTKDTIEQSMQKKQTEAISEVLPMENVQLKAEIIEIEGQKWTIYNAFTDNEYVGSAIESYSNNGFNGLIKIMVGFDPNGKILNYAILEQKETPGLGTKMGEWFRPQQESTPSLIERIFGFEVEKTKRESSIVGLTMQNNLAVKNDGGTIDAITAATISSRAFLEAVNRAYFVFLKATPLQSNVKEIEICDSIVACQDSLLCDSSSIEKKTIIVKEQKTKQKVQNEEVRKIATQPVENKVEVDAIGGATQLQNTSNNNATTEKVILQTDSVQVVDTNTIILRTDTIQSEIGEKNDE